MPRLTCAEQVLFPVEVRPVYADVGDPGTKAFKLIAGKKAIVNKRDNSVVGVVGSGYRLVTNCEAIDAARTCCALAFPESGSVDAPESGSYCHVDLVHSTTALDFEFRMTGERPEVPEVFGPFVALPTATTDDGHWRSPSGSTARSARTAWSLRRASSNSSSPIRAIRSGTKSGSRSSMRVLMR